MAVSIPGNSCRPCLSIQPTGCLFTGNSICYTGPALTGSAIAVNDNMNIVVQKLNAFIIAHQGSTYTANDGLSLTSTTFKLGQTVGQSGNPAILSEDREIPTAGHYLTMTGSGGFSINPPSTPVLSSTKAVFFGDSITVGYGLADSTKRWSTLFCSFYGLTEINNGISGTLLENQSPTTASNMVSRVSSIPTYDSTYRWLFFAYGTNDINYNLTNYNTTNFQSDYAIVINAAIAKGWPVANIVLVGTPYMSVYAGIFGAPGGDLARQNAFNAAIIAVATAFGTKTTSSYSQMAAQGAAKILQADGLHPNVAGHRLISLLIAQTLMAPSMSGQQMFITGTSEFTNIVYDNLVPIAGNTSTLGVGPSGQVGIATTVNANFLNVGAKALFGNTTDSSTATIISQGDTNLGGDVYGYTFRANGLAGSIQFSAGEMMTVGYDPVAHQGIICNSAIPTGILYPILINFNGAKTIIGGTTNTANGSILEVDGKTTINGTVGIGVSTTTANLHLKAGTTAAGTSPLKFNAGALMTALELGAMEFVDNGTTGHLYITLNQGSTLTRVQIV